MANKKVKIAVSFTIVAVLLVWLTLSGFNDNMQYYVSIEQAKSLTPETQSKGLRVKGYLVPGSLVRSPNSLDVQFVIEENGHEMTVHYDKELPDTFKDGSEVLVEGKYISEGYFDARVLMAKCPSKYESGDYNPETHEVTENPARQGAF